MAKIRSDYETGLFARFLSWLKGGSTQLDDAMTHAMDDQAAMTRSEANQLAHEHENLLDARRAALAEREKAMKQCLMADVFVAGANALSMDGQMVSIDGNGNRVAPMIYGPDKVIVVVGKNKIVPDIEAAKVRVQKLAAPANGVRLNTGTPCSVTGECVGGLGCRAPKRMCCTSTVFGFQRDTERFYVFITEEDFGF